MSTPTETATHTPAPWTIGWLGEHGSFEIGVGYLEGQRLGRDGFVIASRADIHHLAEEMRANARLIAAAPDLLAALKKIAANGINADDFSHRIAREAIAKAEGR